MPNVGKNPFQDVGVASTQNRVEMSSDQLQIFAKTQIKQLAETFYSFGGDWTSWHSALTNACTYAQQTEDTFQRAKSGDTDAIEQIADDMGLPPELVQIALETDDLQPGPSATVGPISVG